MQPPSAELPAAHSMDTEWFAIDAHGHVAVFDSGEGGGVPEAQFEAWAAQTMWYELLDELVRLAPPGGVALAFVADGVFDSLEGRYDSGELVTDPGQIDTAYRWELSALLELDRNSAIQPFEHLPSTIGGSQWIAIDGTLHEVD